jgi:hypothetical protein
MGMNSRLRSSNAELGFCRSKMMAVQPARAILLLLPRFKVLMVVLCNKASESDTAAVSFMLFEWRLSFSNPEPSKALKIVCYHMSVTLVSRGNYTNRGVIGPCFAPGTIAVSLLLNLEAAQRGRSVLFLDEQKLLFKGGKRGLLRTTYWIL